MIYCGDNIEIQKKFEDNSVDSVVTDPPYGLGKEPDTVKMLSAWLKYGYLEVKGGGFMGKKWDSFVPQPLFWKEVYRVLKPGGHVLAFCGTRTYDWMVLAMRLAGFEIRDCIVWHYGSGFPKSLSIGKQLDKEQGNEREIVGKNPAYRPNEYTWNQGGGKTPMRPVFKDKGTSEWEGWGTALKPASELICLARKPLSEKTVAQNVLKWGTGGINIDGCRIGMTESDASKSKNNWKPDGYELKNSIYEFGTPTVKTEQPQGRFPANVIFDEFTSQLLDQQAPKTGAFAPVKSGQKEWGGEIYGKFAQGGDDGQTFYEDGLQGASRFFYVAKASKQERNFGLDGFEEKYSERDNGFSSKLSDTKNPRSNFHPTVKPVKLMQYLVRLITPPNGTVLDPFTGSGTTGIACKLEGFNFIGIEREPDYVKIAEARIAAWQPEPVDLTLF